MFKLSNALFKFGFYVNSFILLSSVYAKKIRSDAQLNYAIG